MHGIPRKAPTDEEQQVYSVKAVKLRNLQSQVLHFHRNKIYTKEALEISAKLLESNPEHYTGWNYRKVAVQNLLDQKSETDADADADSDSDSIQSIFDEELNLVENALKKNFKSYGAWHHRKWVLSKGHSSTDKELRLLGKFQKLDSRNFHAWNYRRFITALKKIPDEEELQYTTDMIYNNFSNYSAWHNRSVLLSRMMEKKEKGYCDQENILEEELEFVRNALFTDPDDQSGWFYHLWLLDQTVKLEPLLLSSWPHHGSNLYLLAGNYSDEQSPLPKLRFESEAIVFPVILYFSEAVEGLSSSTVTIEYEYHGSDDIIWRPLSANISGLSHAWLTCLNFPDEVNSIKESPVKVTIAPLDGIKSSSGMICNQSLNISFTISAPSHVQEHVEAQTKQKISWKDENFGALATQSMDSYLLDSFSKLEIMNEKKPTAPEWSINTIANEIAHCRELLSAANCKIGKLTLARLLMAHNTLISYGCHTDGGEVHYEEILALYRDLMNMDPKHISYYEGEHSLVLLKQVTSNMESLSEHFYQYEESTSPSTESYFCARLNGLSLSRIGSMERLLCVQMLDLSHNKLRSIEGLEALQLLSCLNLSHNKLCSFTALEPLKMLKSLEVLDISYNEIGAHSIDTKRYLCSSPLTHSAGHDWYSEKFSGVDVNLKEYWDVFAIFKDLKLIQLDMIGNSVADAGLKSFLFKLMPELNWLDGEENCNQVL